jgi:hypothetical protein
MMKGLSLSVLYVNTQVSIWQLFFTILFIPINAIPGFGKISFKDIPDNIKNGIICLVLEKNTYPEDECSNGLFLLFNYTIINVVYNLLYLYIIKKYSTSLTIISSTISLPVATLLFSVPWIMGNHVVPLDYMGIISLIIVMIGFIIYNLRSDYDNGNGLKPYDDIEVSSYDGSDTESLLSDSSIPSSPFDSPRAGVYSEGSW